MAIMHAQPGEVVKVQPLGLELPKSVTKTLVKTKDLEIIRTVVRAGKELPTRKTAGTMVIHCLEGKILLHAFGKDQELAAEQFLYLPPEEVHELKGIEDSSFLLTILLPPHVS